MRWAEDDEDVPAVVLASTAGACSEYAELGLLVVVSSFGTRAFASLVEGGDPSDGGARARGVNAAFARFAANLAAPRADGVVAKRALASAEATAKALATRGASSDEAAGVGARDRSYAGCFVEDEKGRDAKRTPTRPSSGSDPSR